MQLSDQIREAIRQSGQSIYRVALSTKVEEKSLRRFMRRETGLSMKALDRLAAYFNMNVSGTGAGIEADDV
jgi:hypothetical protein